MSSFYGILLIVALVAMSGAIAYVGDIVGRRMGRKRLSLFGMRPRHTAIAISVMAGMLITIVTLLLAMTVSENVRIGFLRVDALRTETRGLREETKNLKSEMITLKAQRESLAEEVTTLKHRTKELLTERASATQELKSTKAELAKIQAQYKTVNADWRAAKHELVQMQAELTKSRKQLAATEATLTQEQTKLAEAQQARHSAEAAVERQAKEVARLSQEEARLLQEAKELTQKSEALQAQVEDLDQTIYNLKIMQITAQKEFDATLKNITKEILIRQVVFSSGQPLDRLLITNTDAPDAIRQKLEGFITYLDGAVQKAGARPSEGGTQAVFVATYEFNAATNEGRMLHKDEVFDRIVNDAVENFRAKPELKGIIVQAMSLFNCYKNDPVFVDFVTFPNDLVFKQGTEVAEVTVPKNVPDWKVWEQIILLLTKQVREECQGKVMSHLDPSMPYANPQTASVGSLSPQELFEGINRVTHAAGPSRVIAVAKNDTWTIGPLNVELRVEPAR